MKILNPRDLITPKIVEYCKPLSLIFILGVTKSGKVTIARELSKQLDNRTLLISDSYIESHGHEEALNFLERDLNEYHYNSEFIIIEGILAFRLLRRIARNGYYLPDMVIKTECNEATIQHFYLLEEPYKNLNSVFGFNAGLDKIRHETLNIIKQQNKKLPILTLNTSIY
jgi:gluconate kinase